MCGGVGERGRAVIGWVEVEARTGGEGDFGGRGHG